MAQVKKSSALHHPHFLRFREVQDAQAVDSERGRNKSDTVAKLRCVWHSCLALTCFKLVDNSAVTQVLADSGAAFTAGRKRDRTLGGVTPLRASNDTSVKQCAERTVRLHHQAADVHRSGIAD